MLAERYINRDGERGAVERKKRELSRMPKTERVLALAIQININLVRLNREKDSLRDVPVFPVNVTCYRVGKEEIITVNFLSQPSMLTQGTL